MLFCTTGFIGLISFSSVMSIASEDLLAFYRERASQTYNALWYFVGSMVMEVPYIFMGTLIFMALYFPWLALLVAPRSYWLHLSMHVLWRAYNFRVY
ncbi:ABC transporter [Phytophthora megakarya]|uniref:ABC transporter n=1 Tax=Phytophthora megakarya TaxID=4795 RepID=A0A225VLM5_9STRA|nr:ABC transporter [Phytophthora megakarya]